jgi:predicted Zn-dependent peptidase
MTLEDPAEKGFATDTDAIAEVAQEESGTAADTLAAEPETATVIAPSEEAPVVAHGPDLSVLDTRPEPGSPRDYHFPRFERFRLSNGMTVVQAHVPGRALLAAHLILPGGGWTEPRAQAGVSVLAGRAMPEGTQRLSGIEFIEATERLGAEIHADASWEALNVTLEVPRSRFGPALALMAEMAFEPAFPGEEVDRLRDERMNDLLQAWSDPRRRAERVFPETIFDPDTPYSRPLAGIQGTVRPLDRDAVAERHARVADATRATLVVAGDLTGVDLPKLAAEHLGQRPAASTPDPGNGLMAKGHSAGARIVLVDRPSSAQSELRIGHIGVPRKNPDFHAISVLNAILGGTFNSRLNRVIREEKGYSYGIHSSFEMRRRAGPFAVRCAVETAVTVPALEETLRIVRDMTTVEPEPDELRVARDYLVGVFPLRFETAGQVAAALSGLVVFELPDDELDRYRPSVAAVDADAVMAAAQRNIRPSDLSIVIIGDASQVVAPLRAAGLGEMTVIPADASPE